MNWAWYLDNDVQLFGVCVIAMYVYARVDKNVGKMVILGLLAVT